jgi:hypothetical protein
MTGHEANFPTSRQSFDEDSAFRANQQFALQCGQGFQEFLLADQRPGCLQVNHIHQLAQNRQDQRQIIKDMYTERMFHLYLIFQRLKKVKVFKVIW